MIPLASVLAPSRSVEEADSWNLYVRRPAELVVIVLLLALVAWWAATRNTARR